MTFFAMTTRKAVRRRGLRCYGAQAGEAAFLVAPPNASAFEPAHAVAGGRGRAALAWGARVLECASKGASGEAADLVFFVHGYNVDAADALRAHRRVQEGLQAAGSRALVISFDWPAAGSFLNYLEDSSDAYRAAPELVVSGIALFARLARPGCRTGIHVLAHSMGALVVREAFKQARGCRAAAQRAWGVNQVVLVAADISARSAANVLTEPMLEKAQRVTSYASKFDIALATSNVKRFMASPRLGRHGVPASALDRIVDVDCSDRWLSFQRAAAPAGIADAIRSHTWYFEDGERFFPDLAAVLAGDVDRTRIPTREALGAGRLRLRA